MTKPTLPIRPFDKLRTQGEQGKKLDCGCNKGICTCDPMRHHPPVCCKKCPALQGKKQCNYPDCSCWCDTHQMYRKDHIRDATKKAYNGKPEAGWRIRLQKEFFPKHEGDHMDGQYWYIDEDGGGVGQMHKKIKQFIAKQMEKARKEERKWIADKYFGDPQLWWEVKAREELLEDNL